MIDLLIDGIKIQNFAFNRPTLVVATKTKGDVHYPTGESTWEPLHLVSKVEWVGKRTIEIIDGDKNTYKLTDAFINPEDGWHVLYSKVVKTAAKTS